MKKITLPLLADEAFALDKLLNQVPDFLPKTPQGKAMKSICLETSDRVHKLVRKLQKDTDLFHAKKKAKIDLKYHEAYAIFELINALLPATGNNIHLQKINDFLHQKTLV